MVEQEGRKGGREDSVLVFLTVFSGAVFRSGKQKSEPVSCSTGSCMGSRCLSKEGAY